MVLDLEAIKARAEAATPGPWNHAETKGVGQRARLRVVGADGVQVCDCEAPKRADDPLKYQRLLQEDEANTAFIIHAREDIPVLIAEIERLRRRTVAYNSRWNKAHPEKIREYRARYNEKRRQQKQATV